MRARNGLGLLPGGYAGVRDRRLPRRDALPGFYARRRAANGAKGLHAISLGITAFTLTEIRFTPSGAGRGTEPSIHFNPRWRGIRGRISIPTQQTEGEFR